MLTSPEPPPAPGGAPRPTHATRPSLRPLQPSDVGVPVLLNAGSRRAAAAVTAVRERLVARAVAADVRVLTSGADLLHSLDEVAAQGHRVVVVGGGDGTVAAASERLAHSGTVLGVLPLGTANDLARTLHLPADPAAAVDVLLDGKVVDVDLGRVAGGGAFLNVASCGLSVAVTERLSPRLKRRLGPAAYALATVRAYRRHDPFDARLEFPDGDHEPVDLHDVLQLSVANGRHYGGGNTVSPDSSVDDSLLDVYAVVHAPLREHARLVRRLRDGTIVHHSKVLHLTTARLRLETSRPMPLNLDGELAATTPAELSTDPDAVEVIIPTHSEAATHDRRTRRGAT